MKLIKIKRPDTEALVEPTQLKSRKKEGVKYVCKDGKCDSHVILFVTPSAVEHNCPPGSRKKRPLVPES